MQATLHYTITEQDFVDYNLYFVAHDEMTARGMRRLRLTAPALILIGGTLLMYVLDALNVWTVLGYAALAAAAYAAGPWTIRRRVRRNVSRTLKHAVNKHICGEKTLTVDENGVRLTGENEDNTYGFDAFKRVVDTGRQVFLYFDDVSALIVPAAAFDGDAARQEFVRALTARIEAAAAGRPEN